MLVDLDQDTPRTYAARGNPTLELILTLGGGILFLLAIAFMLVVLFLSDTSVTSTQPGMIGGMTVVPIMLISRAIFVMRNITRVTLDRSGITVESTVSFKSIQWTQIARIAKKKRSAYMGQSHQTLLLIDAKGKELAGIRDTIDRFPELIQQIEYGLAVARGAPLASNLDQDEEPVDMARQRRRGILLGSLFAIFALAMAAGVVVSINESIHEKKYASEAATVDAKIIRHYVLGSTHYIDYEFTDPAGQTQRGSPMMYEPFWQDLEHVKTVPVQYLRSDPSWNRLVKGEDRVNFASFWPLGLIVALLLGTGAVFSFLGYDLKSEGITRWGRPLRKQTAISR